MLHGHQFSFCCCTKGKVVFVDIVDILISTELEAMKPVGVCVCMCTRARVHSCLCACDTKFIIVNSQRSSGTTTSKIHME